MKEGQASDSLWTVPLTPAEMEFSGAPLGAVLQP